MNALPPYHPLPADLPGIGGRTAPDLLHPGIVDGTTPLPDPVASDPRMSLTVRGRRRMMLRTPARVLDHLLTNTRRRGDCLVWAGGCSATRYPTHRWRGRSWRVQRLVLLLTTGRLAGANSRITTTCRDPLCVHPHHIRAVGVNQSRIRTPDELRAYLRDNVYTAEASACRIWAGPYAANGRAPMLGWGKRKHSVRRLVLETVRGVKLDARDRVVTTCSEPRCVAPEHLRIVGHADIPRISAERGRLPTGAERARMSMRGHASRAKLGWGEIPRVAQLVADGVLLRDIAVMYDVGPSAVTAAIRRWRRAGLIQW